MKKVLAFAAVLLVATLSSTASAQEVGLSAYLKLLDLAHGRSIQKKIERLESLGFTLSAEGLRDLEQAAAAQESADSTPSTLASDLSDVYEPARSSDVSTGDLVPQFDSAPRPITRRTAPATPAHPAYGRSGTSTRLGATTLYSFDDGTSGTARPIGRTTFYNFSDGTSATSNRIGAMTFYNDSRGANSTTTQIGRIGFYNQDNGVSGTSTQIGGTTFHNFSDGKTCVTNRIGSYKYTNCY